MSEDPSRHLGLDLGATNVKWTVLEHDAGEWRVLDRGHDATPTTAPEAVLARLVEVGRTALSDWPGVGSLGIGVPGLYDAESGAARFLPNLPGDWSGRPVAGPIGTALGLPAFLINDARAFGLAELRMGAGRGCATMAGLTLGSGVGGVVVVDGRVHFGHDGTGGEVGHQTIEADGPPCTCGNRGCLEALTRADRIAAACGTQTAEQAVEAARAGDERAVGGLARIGGYLGIGIANLIVLLTPDRVVIGGGVSAAGDLLLEPIRAEVRRRVHVTDLDRVEIVAAELGTWAGAIGAAVYGAERRRAPQAAATGAGAA
ncbi:MAG: ROK family protein [Candidatus Limnocylindria bacterium]